MVTEGAALRLQEGIPPWIWAANARPSSAIMELALQTIRSEQSLLAALAVGTPQLI
jgi:hypothetical protein